MEIMLGFVVAKCTGMPSKSQSPISIPRIYVLSHAWRYLSNYVIP